MELKHKNINPFIIILLLLFGYNQINAQSNNKKALIVIDIQENLVNPNSKIHIDTTGIDLFFQNINASISKFNENNDCIIYVINEWTNPIQNWGTGNVCKKGGPGVGLDKRMILVNNQVYSKSASNALTNKDLLNYLRNNKITDVYVLGLLAEGCVTATVKGLVKEKFNVIVIQDALGSKSKANKIKALDYFKNIGVISITTKEI